MVAGPQELLEDPEGPLIAIFSAFEVAHLLENLSSVVEPDGGLEVIGSVGVPIDGQSPLELV